MRRILAALTATVLSASLAQAQQPAQTGSIKGKVTIGDGKPIHNADVIVLRTEFHTDTDEAGAFTLSGLKPGVYELVAHAHGLSDARSRVEVKAGGATENIEFVLSLSPVREQVTVTSSGRQETPLETFLSVVSVSQLDLAAKSGSTSLGELLSDQVGIHKRSFGPGTTRPVIRGFDGDRVLVLQDGVRTGTLSSQSGDHGEPIDPTLVERVEVVRGPSTLLYGSNAVGGVVNAVSPEHELHERPHQGLSGNVGATVGSANGQGGGSGNFRYGMDSWQLWGGGGTMRAGDYQAPIGAIRNSGTELKNARLGLGRFSEKSSVSLGYDLQDGRYGVPFASSFEGGDEDIDLKFRRQQVRFSGAVRDLGKYFDQFTLKLNYSDWNHKELEDTTVNTEFFNKQFIYRGELQQKRIGRISGSLGFWGLSRDYKAEGVEALSPPVDQKAFALFAVEQVELERRVRVQFGARFEHNSYDPQGLARRSFNGFSSSAGINVSLWTGGVFVTNVTHSYRAPALEELYNNGPHVGNLAFEIGDAKLKAERTNGLDVSLRHSSQRFRGEANFFQYRMGDFVYGAPTGLIEDGLLELEYSQAPARFTGTELKASAPLHQKVWLNLGFDAVRARLTTPERDLPRIPPVRGRVGLDYTHKGLSVRPEVVLTNRQSRVFPTETETAGFVVPNLTASYSIPKQHAIHVFTANVFNLGNTLYRNHLSFIKELAPEMGRGIRFSYNVHFY